MEPMSVNEMYGAIERGRDYLEHFGIKGMKWGVRNGPPYPLSKNSYTDAEKAYKNIKKAKVSNLNKWGKDSAHNTLFVAGYSGSGKSTTALSLKKLGDTVIHLDGYTEEKNIDIQDKNFTRFLDKHVSKWETIYKANKQGNNGYPKRHSKEYWDKVDAFVKAIENYSAKEYKSGHRVIVEGVQIADGWFEDKKYFRDKPLIILQTGPIKSVKRAFDRDDRGGLIKGFGSIDSAKEYAKWYYQTNKSLNDLSNTTKARRGKEYVQRLFA